MRIYTAIMILTVAVAGGVIDFWSALRRRAGAGDHWIGDLVHAASIFVLAVPFLLMARRYAPDATLRRIALWIFCANICGVVIHILYYIFVVRGPVLMPMDVWASVMDLINLSAVRNGSDDRLFPCKADTADDGAGESGPA